MLSSLSCNFLMCSVYVDASYLYIVSASFLTFDDILIP